MRRPLSYLLAVLVLLFLAASMFAPAPGSRIVSGDKEGACKVLQKQYQVCISTHADVAPCEEITAAWLRCVKNQGAAGVAK